MRKFLIIGGISLVVLGVIASVIVIGRTLLSNAATPAPTNTQPVIRIPPPTPDTIASPTAINNLPAPASKMSTAELLGLAATTSGTTTPTLTNGWTVVGSGDVTVTPQLSADKQSLNLNFQSGNFSKITDISYSLSYIADPGVTKLVKGNFSPTGQSSPLIKVVALGTCSGANCLYDTNPRSFTLKVLVKTNYGLNVYLLTLTSSSG